MNIILWDIDNCIADDIWRIPFINWSAPDPHSRYMPYHNLCSGDKPSNQSEFGKLHHDLNATPCFITARPEVIRHMTRSWLRRHFVPVFTEENRLLMRGNADHSPSVELKRSMVSNLLTAEAGVRIVLALDDRPDVLAMYQQQFGIETRLMAIHSVCAYTPPKKGP